MLGFCGKQYHLKLILPVDSGEAVWEEGGVSQKYLKTSIPVESVILFILCFGVQ